MANANNIRDCWLRGASAAAGILRAHELFTAEEVDWLELDRSGVYMFKPDGVHFTGLGPGVDDEGDAPAGGQAAKDNAYVADADDSRLVDEAFAAGTPELQRHVRTVSAMTGSRLAWTPLVATLVTEG